MKCFRPACLLLLAALVFTGVELAAAQAADSAAFRVYTSEGRPAVLDDVVAAMDTAEVVLLGEVHDDATAHALQLELLRRAARRYAAGADSASARPVALSLEMLARDVQPVVDEYLAGLIPERHFLAASRPWPNYHTAYRPLVEFARAHGLPVIAANAPRRYVNRVARLGRGSLDTLSAWAKQWLPPLPYADPSPQYRARWEREMRAALPAHGADADSAAAHGHPHGAPDLARLLDAQALWDATMAYSLAEHLLRAPEELVLHLAGSFHVAAGTGIAEHLARYRPSARVLTVVFRPTASPATFDPEEHAGLAGFVVLTSRASEAAEE